MKWRIVWTPRAEKDIDALDPATVRRVLRVLDRFSETGHADLRRLVNTTPERYRIRAGNHRIIVRLLGDEEEARILRIRRRDSAYRAERRRHRGTRADHSLPERASDTWPGHHPPEHPAPPITSPTGLLAEPAILRIVCNGRLKIEKVGI